MLKSIPKTHSLTLLGGGFASLSALSTLLKSPPLKHPITVNLVTATHYFEYTPAILTTMHNASLFRGYHVEWREMVENLLERNAATVQRSPAFHVNVIYALCREMDAEANSMKLTLLGRKASGLNALLHRDHALLQMDSFRAEASPYTHRTENILQSMHINVTHASDAANEVILPYDYALLGTGSRQSHSFIRYSPYLHHIAPNEDLAQKHFDLYGSNESVDVAQQTSTSQLLTLMDTDLRIASMKRFRRIVQDSGRVLILGGGGIGTELSGELVDLRRFMGITPRATRRRQITLAHSRENLLPGFPSDASQYSMQFMRKRGVNLLTNLRLNEKSSPATNPNSLPIFTYTAEGGHIDLEADLVIPTTGMIPNTEYLSPSLLDKRGFLYVNEHLQSHHANVFGAGDMTTYDTNTASHMPLEFKKATTANNQGKTAAQNILRLIEAGNTPTSLLVHKPKKFRYDISLGKYDGFVVTSAGIESSGLFCALRRRRRFYTRLRQKMGKSEFYTSEIVAAAVVGTSVLLLLVMLVVGQLGLLQGEFKDQIDDEAK